MYPVITISREFGSGGHSIGEAVAKQLNIPFYDGEIVNRVAVESGYAKELIETQGEYTSSTAMWFDISAAGTMYFQSPQDEIFIAQKKVILDCASKGPCVIVGRCADYVLEEYDNVVDIFIHADFEHRCRTVMARDGLSEKKALDAVIKNDKERMSYYNYYTNNKWGDCNNYNLTIDSGMLGLEGSVNIIKAFIDNAEKNRKQ